MTSEQKKAIWSAVGVLICFCAVGTGAVMRDRLEMGSNADQIDISNLVASNSQSQAVPETKFYEDILELLKRKYVEPITDERKLADGSVRAMVGSLGDPNSLYMDKDQFRVYSQAREGHFEGIGALMVLDNGGGGAKVQTSGDQDEALSGQIKLPKLVVASVIPGSSADKAGVKPGDWVEFVDDHWIPNSEALEEFLKLQNEVLGGKASPEKSSAYMKLRDKLRDESDKSLLPLKGRDLLMMGTTGRVKIRWARGTDRIETTLDKGEWKALGVRMVDGMIRLPLYTGAADDLAKLLENQREVTLDLRGVASDDDGTMIKCLSLLVKSGTYGEFATQKKESPLPLTIKDGNSHPPKVRIIVDKYTRGMPEVMTAVLASQGAQVVGDGMADQPYLIRWFKLDSGAGYTLVTGEYTPSGAAGKVAAKEAVK